jgi:AcrR family transcriptional regulator
MSLDTEPVALTVLIPRGRPRSDDAHRAILHAFHELLIEVGFARLRLEHVAARAGTSKATIYRRWRSKEELAIELLRELAIPHIVVPDSGHTREELRAITLDVIERLTQSAFGPVIRRLLCEIAGNATVGEAFRTSVVEPRRDEVRVVIERGIQRGELRASVDAEIVTELLVGSICFRLIFGGTLDERFSDKVVDVVMCGYGPN